MIDGLAIKKFLRDTYHEFAGTDPGEPIPPTAAAILALAFAVDCSLSAEGEPLHEWLETAMAYAVRDGVREALTTEEPEPNLVLPPRGATR